MMIAGIGCRLGAGADVVLAAIDAALVRHGLVRQDISAIAVLPQKAQEPGIVEAARRLAIPLQVVAPEAIETPSRSQASVEATGHGSASEAAALAAAGHGGRLVGVRIVHGSATCALAVGNTS